MRAAGWSTPYVLAAVGYMAITLANFHNLLPVIGTQIYADTGDSLLNASILAWNAQHVPLSEAWWNYPAFAPLSGVTAWTEHLLAAYPLTTPLMVVSANPLLVYNILLLTCFALNALAMFALARHLTGSAPAAFVAGLAFAFAPYQSGRVAHIQMLMAFGMPLAVLGLHQWVEDGRRAGIGWFTAGWVVVALSSAYMLLFFPVFVALWCAWFAWGRWTRLVPIAVSATLVVIAISPLLWGYHIRQEAYGFARQYDEIRSFAADVSSVAWVPHQDVLWSRVLTTTSVESSFFPGVAIVLLAAIGVIVHRGGPATRRNPIWFYGTGAVVVWLFALGPEPTWHGMRLLAYGPYRLLLLLPGASSVRVPARIWLIAVMCLAVAAGGGAAALARSPRWRHVVWVCAVLVMAEGWLYDSTYAVPIAVPANAIPRAAVVLDLPIGATADNVPAEFLAVTHGYRVVNGYSGYAGPHFAALRETLAAHDPSALNAFRRLDDLYVIVRPAVDAPFLRWMTEQPGTRLLVGSATASVYLLPHLPDSPRVAVPLPLPTPHELPFQLH